MQHVEECDDFLFFYFFVNLQEQEVESDDVMFKNFKCRRCSKGFMTENELAIHIMEHIHPPGEVRKGRLPKADKKIIPAKRKKNDGEEISDNDSESDKNDKDFVPKTYQLIKQEPGVSKALKVLPKRSLKGKRTTGFFTDAEFVMTRSQIKIEPEEKEDIQTESDKSIVETPKRGKRGRPKKESKNIPDSTVPEKRQKIFEKQTITDNSQEDKSKDARDSDDKANKNFCENNNHAIISADEIRTDKENNEEKIVDSNTIMDGDLKELDPSVSNTAVFPTVYLNPNEGKEIESKNAGEAQNEEINKYSLGREGDNEGNDDATGIASADDDVNNEETDNEDEDYEVEASEGTEEDEVEKSDTKHVTSNKKKTKLRKRKQKRKQVETKGKKNAKIKEEKQLTDEIDSEKVRKRKKKCLPLPMKIRELPDGKKEFVCTVCNRKFFSERYLRLHFPMHTSEFKCETCDKTFTRKESMQKHQCRIMAKVIKLESSEISENSFKYKCSNCDETYPTYEAAEKHLVVHRKGLKCDNCGQTFVKILQFNQHECPNSEKSKFSCDICFQTFGNEKNLFRHVAMHTDLYKCESCGKCFSRKDSLIRHVTKCCPEKAQSLGIHFCSKCQKTFGTKLGLENHEANCKMHKCVNCNQVFDLETSLTSHQCEMVEDSKDSTLKRVKFSCSECNKTFRNLHYLLQHKQVHIQSHECQICGKKLKSLEEKEDHGRLCLAASKIKAEGKIKCDRCSEEFFMAKDYRDHYITHTHSFRCEKCDKRFVKIGTLHNHQCIGAEGIACEFCARQFKNQRTYHMHMLTHASFVTKCSKCEKYFSNEMFDAHECTEVEPPLECSSANYVCHFCGKNFVSTSNLNKHIRVHGEKNIECPYCDKKFHYPEYLKTHIAGVHEKKTQYQCSDCGKILTSKPGLISHTKLYHSENKNIYPCPECGKCFSQKGNMKTHMFSHAKEKSFQCGYCSKSFKYPDQLNRHKLSHTIGMKFQCDICEKSFVKDYELKKHMQANHSSKMYVCEFCGSRCGHKHTLQRHYRRKHPASAHLVEDASYIDSLYQEVDLDTNKTEMSFVEMVPAAEALSSLSTSVTQQAVISSELTQLISQDGTIVQLPGQENVFTIPTNQEQGGEEEQQTVVILQIVNPQEQQIEVTELETQVIDTMDVETSQDVGDFQYTENIITS